MYIHLGNDYSVKKRKIIGIFDIENTSVSKDTKEFLKKSQKDGEVIYLTSDLPKSFIVCEEKGEKKTYISKISPATLKKRFIEDKI